MLHEITNKRNQNGVKSFCDQYRFFDGEHYVCEISGQINAAEMAQKFRSQGAKVRRLGDDVYVRLSDIKKINH